MEETIFIISASVVASGLCGGFLSYLFCKAEPSLEHKEIVDANEAFREFNPAHSKIIAERELIITRFYELKQYVNSAVPLKNSDSLFFKAPKNQSSDKLSDQSKYKQFDALAFLLNSYPDFDETRNHDSKYIRDLHHELEEHHQKTLDVAQDCFQIMSETSALLGKDHLQLNSIK